MALAELVIMTPEYQQYLINIVHDEIFLEVPDEMVEAAENELKNAMLDAGYHMLYQ